MPTCSSVSSIERRPGPAWELVLPPLVEILSPGGEIFALVKPQFEIGKDALPSDGVVKSEADREAVLENLRAFIEHETPWSVIGEMQSPIMGEKGSVEVFFHLRLRVTQRAIG